MNADDVCALGAVELAGMLRARELSAAEALEAVLERADGVGPNVNPFALRLDERARTAAEEADRLLARGEGGPLCGVPVSIKDAIWVEGVPCAHGCRALADFTPPESSLAVERLGAAGAVVFAKTTCSELSFAAVTETELCGRTSNPWDPARTSGGSSGGAAACVAAGLGPLALGGDDGGSIRIPASFCGLVGLKPTFGLVPTTPGFEICPSLNAVGPIARSAADCRLMLAVLADEPLAVGPRTLDGLTLAVLSLEGLSIAPDARRAFEELCTALEGEGVGLVEVERRFEDSRRMYATTAGSDAYSAYAPLLEHREALGEKAAHIIESGAAVADDAYTRAQKDRVELERAYDRLLAENGARFLITPAVGCEAMPHGHETLGHSFDWFLDANLAGLPACVVPVGLGDHGLPLGAQIVGRRGDDAGVLELSEAVEQLVHWQLSPLRAG